MPVRSLFVCTSGASIDRPALYSVNLISPISTALRRPHDAIYTERSLPPCVCTTTVISRQVVRDDSTDPDPRRTWRTCLHSPPPLPPSLLRYFFGRIELAQLAISSYLDRGRKERGLVSSKKEISKFLEALTTGGDRRHRQALIGGIQRLGSGR